VPLTPAASLSEAASDRFGGMRFASHFRKLAALQAPRVIHRTFAYCKEHVR